jgi:hypothetical protein
MVDGFTPQFGHSAATVAPDKGYDAGGHCIAVESRGVVPHGATISVEAKPGPTQKETRPQRVGTTWNAGMPEDARVSVITATSQES